MRTTYRYGRIASHIAVVGMAALLMSSCVNFDVQKLASDQFDGRDNNTAGSTLSQNYLLSYLTQHTVGANSAATGDDAYKQSFTNGTNIVGVVPGSDLADQYVLIGAHYDHLGHSCRDLRANDNICNGATDNATSVAALLQIASTFVNARTPPHRSIIFAFWDREEDGLVGSAFYAAHPLIPLAKTVAYVNLDIQGANLRPSLRNFSFAIGAETGGPQFQQLVQQAIAPSPLGTRQLSVAFGQGRSDHVSLIGAGIPSVFFSDATGPCYHTDSDDLAVVDFTKLNRQIGILQRLMTELTSTASLPTFTIGTPLATYSDAQVLTDAIDALQADLASFPPDQQTNILTFRTQLHAIISAGPGAFDGTAMNTLFSISLSLVQYFTSGPCSGFLP